MKKPLRIALTVLGTLVAVPVLALATTSIVNVVATNQEAAQIVPYGQLVEVDGKSMNVVVSGSGDETIVLLPGLGTAAPGLDFQPLIEELDDTYRVVAVEPFGTGLSDPTDVERTADTITREVHEALQQLGVDRYVLMGHSIAGIYALTYAEKYADELIAFVGIDSSVPNQSTWDTPIPVDAIAVLQNLGIVRVVGALSGETVAQPPFDLATTEQMKLLSSRNGMAPTILNEMANAPANFASVSTTTFPADLPVLLFVATLDSQVDGWVEIHEAQAASVDNGWTVILEGTHYLHHLFSPEIARDTTAFLAELG